MVVNPLFIYILKKYFILSKQILY